jgi:hypothetical protein
MPFFTVEAELPEAERTGLACPAGECPVPLALHWAPEECPARLTRRATVVTVPASLHNVRCTLIKKKVEFSKYTGSAAKSYIANGSSSYMVKYLSFLGSPSSYMTLQPIPCEFPYIWGKFLFLFYPCTMRKVETRDMTKTMAWVY